MEPSPQNQKRKLRISLTAMAVIALAAVAFFVFVPEGYGKEQERFAKVLKEASDEELFTVLNYAIANHYVPNRDIDPFFNRYVMVGCWRRTLMVYRNLSDRKDLLKKIYPDLKVLDEYVNWGRHGEPYPNDKVAQKILDNVQEESQKMDDELWSKYFGTPLLHH